MVMPSFFKNMMDSGEDAQQAEIQLVLDGLTPENQEEVLMQVIKQSIPDPVI